MCWAINVKTATGLYMESQPAMLQDIRINWQLSSCVYGMLTIQLMSAAQWNSLRSCAALSVLCNMVSLATLWLWLWLSLWLSSGLTPKCANVSAYTHTHMPTHTRTHVIPHTAAVCGLIAHQLWLRLRRLLFQRLLLMACPNPFAAYRPPLHPSKAISSRLALHCG